MAAPDAAGEPGRSDAPSLSVASGPRRLHVDAVREPEEVTFQELMAEQLRRAPWFMLSLGFHCIAFLVLAMLMPGEKRRESQAAVHLQAAEPQQVETVQPPPPKPLEPEKTKVEPTLQDQTVADTTTDKQQNDVADVPAERSALDGEQWNATLGMSGGARGRCSNRGNKGGGGGSPRPEQPAIGPALQWLARHQDADGKWDCDQFMKHDKAELGEICDGPGNGVHDVGVTGLALLAFLGDGSTLRAGPFKDNIKRGVIWLRDQQQENGLFGQNNSNDFVYDHAIAAYAMCEAYGLSEYQTLKMNAQRGINYLDYHRNPYRVWRYQPRDSDNDSSVTGWCILCYESGKCFGLDVDEQAFKQTLQWYDSVTDKSGRTGYTRLGEPSSRHPGEPMTRFPPDKGEALSAVSLFVRYFLGQTPKEAPVMDATADLLLTKMPVWDEQSGAIDMYYWYYGSYALFQKGGRHWRQWSEKISQALLPHQHKAQNRNLEGSWDPVGVWGGDGGRVYATAICALTLEAYARYSRLVH
jgi:hypothetical protein